jgi:OFA family oxalate/formate antiporter-like MFS transporter
MNRSLVVVGALLIQLSLGAIYAWSVFTTPLVEAGWTRAQTQAVFSAGLVFFAVVMVVAGRLTPRVRPRKLAISGGVVLGLGYVLAGLLGETSFFVLFICIGVIGGSGIGLAYLVPIAVGIRWFPDKKGMITGLTVAGFGFGPMLWVKLAGTWGHLIDGVGLGNTFIVFGVAFFAMIVAGGVWMKFPPGGWQPAGWKEEKVSAGAAGDGVIDLTSGPMLRTPQFYMISLTFLFSASAGLMSIGLMKLFPGQALESNGIDHARASAIAGTAMAVFFSLANGAGRIGWGTISDRIGRKPSIFLMTALQGVMMMLFPFMAGTPALLYLGAALIGFNFGGNFALFPTFTADTFGTRYIGQNYGWVFLAYGAGGIFGPILGGQLGDMGNFPLAFTIVGVLCLLAAVIIALVRRPRLLR